MTLLKSIFLALFISFLKPSICLASSKTKKAISWYSKNFTEGWGVFKNWYIPQANEGLEVVKEFYNETYRPNAIEGVDLLTDVMLEKIHPSLINNFSDEAELLAWAGGLGLDYWRPRLKYSFDESKDYIYYLFPEFWDEASQVPAPIKKGFGYLHTSIMIHTTKQIRENGVKGNLPDYASTAVSRISDSMVISKNKKRLKELNIILNSIRRYAEDRQMRDCYKVVLLESKIINAYNNGCNIFITTGILEVTNSNEEIAAIMAHEMTHGDHGHAFKTLGILLGTSIKHIGVLNVEGLYWLFTGDEGRGTFSEVIEEGQLPVWLKASASHAPALEIDADRGAARILIESGIGKHHMKNVLIKLHGFDVETFYKQEIDHDNDLKSIRNYPSLLKRLQAIDSVQ